MFIFGKIKTYIIATLAIALPILYVMGRIKGSANEQNKVLKDDLQAQEKAKDFYKAMSENEKTNITDRSGLTDRLRGNGL
jgi:2-hydroxy-3-keto-5-methylthiopentenyl-1-phosphate phosphatase|tara:strand:- start:488 stop:727 length:240 start_codon:yes stop_codon:yes gene_type:complete